MRRTEVVLVPRHTLTPKQNLKKLSFNPESNLDRERKQPPEKATKALLIERETKAMESPAEIDGDRVKGFRRRVCVCVWLRERNRESYARRRGGVTS